MGEECEDPLPPLEVLSSSRAVQERVVVANGTEEVEDVVSGCGGGAVQLHPVPLPPQRGYECDIPVLDEVPTLESILSQVRGRGGR